MACVAPALLADVFRRPSVAAAACTVLNNGGIIPVPAHVHVVRTRTRNTNTPQVSMHLKPTMQRTFRWVRTRLSICPTTTMITYRIHAPSALYIIRLHIRLQRVIKITLVHVPLICKLIQLRDKDPSTCHNCIEGNRRWTDRGFTNQLTSANSRVFSCFLSFPVTCFYFDFFPFFVCHPSIAISSVLVGVWIFDL